jgi:bacillithiol biosynthesis deacetylase BshB1
LVVALFAFALFAFALFAVGPAMIDLLAIAAHRDDVELTCAGTLIKAAKQGYKTAVVDLTAGEMGTKGDAKSRAVEAENAAEIMRLSARENLGLPDAAIMNDPDTRIIVARVIRKFKPKIVIAPARQGRHPDHHVTSELVRDACFIAGLAKVAPDIPKHRPKKVLHCVSYRQDFEKPTFVVDISDEFEQKLEAIRCFDSQFAGVTQAGEVLPTGEPLYDALRHYAASYGAMIRTRYGEPFFTTETMRVDDVVALEVSTF